MKKIILLISLTLLFIVINKSASAQEKSFDSIADLRLPKGLECLDRQKQEALIKVRPKSKKYLQMNKGNLYKIGTILLKINASKSFLKSENIKAKTIIIPVFYQVVFPANNDMTNFLKELTLMNTFKGIPFAGDIILMKQFVIKVKVNN